jgi:hypothetical protein
VEGALCRITSNDGSSGVIDRDARAYKLRTPRAHLPLVKQSEVALCFNQRQHPREWEFAFELTGLWAWPMAYLLMTLTFRRAMRDCLVLTKQCLEEPLPQPAGQH